MTPPLHAVARGVRLTNVGFLLTGWAGAAAFILFWFLDRVVFNSYSYTHRSDAMRWVFIGVWIATLAAALAGVIVGFVGRCFCLRAPAEFPGVRGRAMTAVVLEGSGWFSLLVGFGVSLAMSFRWLPDAQYVPGIGLCFSLLLMVCGRILFLRFLRKLAVVVEDKPSVRRAKLSLTLFVADWLVALLSLGITLGGSELGLEELTTPISSLFIIAVGMSGLYGLILYDRLLSHLGRSVQAFADEYHAEDDEYEPRPEREDEPDEESADD